MNRFFTPVLTAVVSLFLAGGALAQKPPPFKETLIKAENGDLKSQFNVGLMYEKGDGIAKDLAKAFEWYERAAEKNLVPAQINLAYLYMRGQGVEKSNQKACLWFTLAANNKAPDVADSQAKTCGGLNAEGKEWVKLQVVARKASLI